MATRSSSAAWVSLGPDIARKIAGDDVWDSGTLRLRTWHQSCHAQSGRWPMLSPKAVSGDYACPA
eukprot:3384239-Prymnesium_polylepis.1